jgi:hypothetical protein
MIRYPDLLGATWVQPAQLAALDCLIPAHGNFLEVGTAAGITAAKLAKPGRTVVCVDTFCDADSPQVIEQDGDRWTAWRRNNPHACLWRGDLKSFRDFSRISLFDVILIDADHRGSAVSEDLMNSILLVKPGGVICAHDYGDPVWTEVQGAVDGFCERFGWRIIEQIGAMVVLKSLPQTQPPKAAQSHPSVRGVVCSVGYDDLLAITLPRNMRHLTECLVVSSPDDARTQAVVESVPSCNLFTTDAATRNGARFNKGAAMEEAFDALGRDGWILIWDADILLPDRVEWVGLEPTVLYGSRRRMLVDAKKWNPEMEWQGLPLSHEVGFPGYFQLFCGNCLSVRPWYATHSPHAAIGDAHFEGHFRDKRHLPFEVLHLGPRDTNWFGRASERLDGLPSNLTEEEVVQLFQTHNWHRPKQVSFME